MKKLILVFGLILVFAFVLGGCEGVTTPGNEGYVWEEPNGYFKVTIPNDYEFKEELTPPEEKTVHVYKFVKQETGEYLFVWWENKSVHNFDSIDERVEWNINLFIDQYGGSNPLIEPKDYKDGKYWMQKSSVLSTTVLFYLRQDPNGNFMGYEYYKPFDLGSITDTSEMLTYLSSFEF